MNWKYDTILAHNGRVLCQVTGRLVEMLNATKKKIYNEIQPWKLLLHISEDIWWARHTNQNLCTPLQPGETKWEMSGKTDERQKNMRILISSGFVVLKKLKRIDFQHMSLLPLLKWGHWQAVEKLLKSHVLGRCGTRFCEMEVNLGETNLWGEGDRVKWGTCGPRATPIWCLNAIQMWQPARSSTFRFALPIAPSRVISVL